MMMTKKLRDRHLQAAIERIGAAFDEQALFDGPVVRAVRRLREPVELVREGSAWRMPGPSAER